MPSRRYQDPVEAVDVVTLPPARHAGAESGVKQFQQHRQCEFGRSSPRHLLTGRSVAGRFCSGRTVSGHFLLDARCQGISFWTHGVRGFSFWMQPCQRIFLLDAAVSGQMASGRHVSWHRGYAGCQGPEHRSKYSRRIPKHVAGSRHSDSVQFYSLYLMYIYICYYHTSRFQHKHPASHPLLKEYRLAMRIEINDRSSISLNAV